LSNLSIRETGGGVVFTVKVVPHSSRTAIAGLLDGMVKIKVSAPAEKSKANRCLIDFLAKKLGVRKNTISIISGQTSPVKLIKASDISVEILRSKLDL